MDLFTNEKKYRVDSVLFFSRTDGKLSKADTDYLEKRVIQDFIEKSDYEMMNHTSGNDSFIDKLQKAKSDQLYDTAFEIIDEIVNIDYYSKKIMGYVTDKIRIYNLDNGTLEKEIPANLTALFAYSNNAILLGNTVYSNYGIKYIIEE